MTDSERHVPPLPRPLPRPGPNPEPRALPRPARPAGPSRPGADPARHHASITVLGATTCEDTALVRSRLRGLRVPFEELDVDLDPDAADRLARLTGGPLVTPTLVLAGGGSDSDAVASEPDLDRLGELLAGAGYDARPPSMRQLHGEVITRPVPMRALPTPEGGTFSIEQVRTRTQVALFLAHDASCLACFGFAKQLARQHGALEAADAIAVVVADGDAAGLASWRHELGPGAVLAANPDGAWKRAVVGVVDAEPGAVTEGTAEPAAASGVALLALDRFAAPRASSFAPEAGGLANPSDAIAWLDFVALDCPECSLELPWPEDA